MQHLIETAIHRRVAELRAGRDDSLLARCASGWAVFGRQQFVKGYLLLLPDPVVPGLNALSGEQRAQFTLDMSSLGDAPALHAHVIPRFSDEPEAMRAQHPWAYDWNRAPAFDAAAAAPLANSLRAELAKLGALRSP